MKIFRPLYIILLLPALLFSCTERIDIKLDESSVRLVVDGAITTDTTAHTILLTTTSSYFYNQPAPKVTGAIVSISDGSVSYDLHEETPGVYRTEPTVFGLSGHTYTLNIRLAENIGGSAEYTASSTLFPVNKMDSVGLVFHPDWSKEGVWEVQCFVQDPPTNDYYRFLISRNDTMVTDTLKEWFVTDDRFFNGNYANGVAIGYLDQRIKGEIVRPGDKIKVEINNIGDGYANFIWDAQAEVRGSNPLFSGPPSNVKGNLNNGAIGFFAAYSATRAGTAVP